MTPGTRVRINQTYRRSRQAVGLLGTVIGSVGPWTKVRIDNPELAGLPGGEWAFLAGELDELPAA